MTYQVAYWIETPNLAASDWLTLSFPVSQGKAADLSDLNLKVRSIPSPVRKDFTLGHWDRSPFSQTRLCRLLGCLLRLPCRSGWTPRSPRSPRGQRTTGTYGEKRSRRLPSRMQSLIFNLWCKVYYDNSSLKEHYKGCSLHCMSPKWGRRSQLYVCHHQSQLGWRMKQVLSASLARPPPGAMVND